MKSCSVGNTIRWAGLTLVVTEIMQPYSRHGLMLAPIARLIDTGDDRLFGYMPAFDVADIIAEQGGEQCP